MKSSLLSMRQVAARLGFGRTKTYELLVSGEIPSVRFGHGPKARYRVDAQVLERWIAAQSTTRREPVISMRGRSAADERRSLGLDELHEFVN